MAESSSSGRMTRGNGQSGGLWQRLRGFLKGRQGETHLRETLEEIIDEIGKIAPDVLASVAKDDIGQRVYQSYIGARDQMRGWTSIAEPQFIAARQRVLGA